MADETIVLTSAVVIPEPEPTPPRSPPATGSLKRRQSSNASTDSKRPRLSYDAAWEGNGTSSPPPRPGGTRSRPVRNPSGQEERQRGKRLFGALLGTLSQTKTTVAQRKRAEIEQKQQEKLRQQTEEDEAERRIRLDKLGRKRRREQWDWEERSLRSRHESMRAQAGMLKTTATPPLYFLPYELTKEEDETIKRQRDETEDDIDRELDDFEERRRLAIDQLNAEDDTSAEVLPADEAHLDARTNDSSKEAAENDQTPTNGSISILVPDGGAVKTETGSLLEDSTGMTGDERAADTGSSTPAQPINDEPAQELLEPEATVQETLRDVHDDAGEVLEGDEDTVNY